MVEVINTNHESINKRAGQEINVKYVLDLRDFPGDPVEKSSFTITNRLLMIRKWILLWK